MPSTAKRPIWTGWPRPGNSARRANSFSSASTGPGGAPGTSVSPTASPGITPPDALESSEQMQSAQPVILQLVDPAQASTHPPPGQSRVTAPALFAETLHPPSVQSKLQDCVLLHV